MKCVCLLVFLSVCAPVRTLRAFVVSARRSEYRCINRVRLAPRFIRRYLTKAAMILATWCWRTQLNVRPIQSKTNVPSTTYMYKPKIRTKTTKTYVHVSVWVWQRKGARARAFARVCVRWDIRTKEQARARVILRFDKAFETITD